MIPNIIRNVKLRGRKPDLAVSVVFNRYEMENPDLPVEDIIGITASHFGVTPQVILKRLWG